MRISAHNINIETGRFYDLDGHERVRYNVNVHYCVISYPTLKLSFQERISTLTVQTKDDLIRRMCEKHPQFVFDVLIGSTQEHQTTHCRQQQLEITWSGHKNDLLPNEKVT
jgi:hypothetical protein